MQFDKFTIKSQEAIQESQSIAERNGHQEIRPEHLLAVLLAQQDGVIIPVLQKMGVNLSTLRDEAKRLLDNLPKVSGAGFGQVYAAPQFKKMSECTCICRYEYFSLGGIRQYTAGSLAGNLLFHGRITAYNVNQIVIRELAK